MSFTGNSLNTSNLASITRQATPRILDAIKQASARTGVDFAYLVEKAAVESSFNAKAQSRSSSATGLYQFIESTWMKMVKTYGHKYGMGKYADCLDANGCTNNAALKKEILELRKDPETSALMAAEFAAENKRYLEQHVDGAKGDVGSTELYLAHFLGAGSATEFLNAYRENPMANAADLFPKAARANRNVFYDRTSGESRTLAGVYDFFAKKFGAEPATKTQTVAAPPRTETPRLSRESATQMLIEQEMSTDQAALDFINTEMKEDRSSFASAFTGPRPETRAQQATAALRGQIAGSTILLAQLEAPATRQKDHRDVNRYNG